MRIQISAARSASASAFLLFIFAVAEALGSPATLAIVKSSYTVCGILAGQEKILCSSLNQPAIQLNKNLTFKSISGGRDFFCGISSGGFNIFCWNLQNSSIKRIYNGNFPLVDITVGDDQVCAFEQNRSRVLCWRGGGSFPAIYDGNFRSLTSGRGFSCGIEIENKVKCWGPRGAEFENFFRNISMQSIVAGDSHVCGIDFFGFLICKGNNSFGQLNFPTVGAFEFSGLALGETHSCAIKKQNGTVICWGGKVSSYSPDKNLSFEFIVAGGDLTCGVITNDFTVRCWRANGINNSLYSLQLPQILPGICVAEKSFCKCGVFPDSKSLCSSSGIICNSCEESPSISQPASIPLFPPSFFKPSKTLISFCIIGSILGLAAICIVLFCIWNNFFKNKKVHNSIKPPPLPTQNIPKHSPNKISISNNKIQSSFKEKTVKFTFEELAAATQNFSPESRIGIGSFGTVYKGKLKNNRKVAIKRCEFRSNQKNPKFSEKEQAFQSELIFLSRLHHKHLVELVGYCDQKNEMLIVYEFMQNGALYDHLHTNKSSQLNSWKTRINILLDAARGVDYLHNYAVPAIIHRDIKSSNILLDSDWVGKVSDFGLSLNWGESVSCCVSGTMGYIDPEYYGGLESLTKKSDVYGFGVVMLEMLTGKRAIFEEGGENVSVVEYVKGGIEGEGGIGGVLDGRVGRVGRAEMEEVEKVGWVAVGCVGKEGRERPSIREVVMKLESAVGVWEREKEDSWSGSNLSLSSRD